MRARAVSLASRDLDAVTGRAFVTGRAVADFSGLALFAALAVGWRPASRVVDAAVGRSLTVSALIALAVSRELVPTFAAEGTST